MLVNKRREGEGRRLAYRLAYLLYTSLSDLYSAKLHCLGGRERTMLVTCDDTRLC
jgi:hypothetical protein